jgi:hypothetical protein
MKSSGKTSHSAVILGIIKEAGEKQFQSEQLHQDHRRFLNVPEITAPFMTSISPSLSFHVFLLAGQGISFTDCNSLEVLARSLIVLGNL